MAIVIPGRTWAPGGSCTPGAFCFTNGVQSRRQGERLVNKRHDPIRCDPFDRITKEVCLRPGRVFRGQRFLRGAKRDETLLTWSRHGA